MKQVLRSQFLQPYSYEYTDFSEAGNFEQLLKIRLKTPTQMLLSNVCCFHICVPVWSIKIVAQLVDMKFSLYESSTSMVFDRLKMMACKLFLVELTKPQNFKSIKPPTQQQISVPFCELRYMSNIFWTHDIGQWNNMDIYHLVVWVKEETETISREEYCKVVN